MKRLIILTALLFVTNAALAADICRLASRSDDWVLAHDPKIQALMQKFMANLPGERKEFIPLVCTYKDPRSLVGPGSTRLHLSGGKRYLLLLIGERTRRAIDGNLPGFVGHEIGHWFMAVPWACSVLVEWGTDEARQNCEHQIDLISARWTSRQEVFNGLQSRAQFVRRLPKSDFVDGEDREHIIAQLEDRMRLLGTID